MNQFNLPLEAIVSNLPQPTVRYGDRESVVLVTGADDNAGILSFNDERVLLENFSIRQAAARSFETENVAWRILANRALNFYSADLSGRLTGLSRAEWMRLVLRRDRFLIIGADNVDHRFYLRLDPATLSYLLKLRDTAGEVIRLGEPFGIKKVECERVYKGLGESVWDGTHSFGNLSPCSFYGADEFLEPCIRKTSEPCFLLREDVRVDDDYGLCMWSLLASVFIDSEADQFRFFFGGRGSEAIYSVPVSYDLINHLHQSCEAAAVGA